MFEGPEKKFQKHIADFLIREHGFSVLTQDEITDTDFYFAEDHLYAFPKATQAETLERLETNYGSDARDEIFKALPARPAFTLFPRFHQRRCVDRTCTAVVDHFVEHGNLGLKLLENHSAGSGKTLTMCWMADRLNSLYKPGTAEKIVDIVFLITDRKSLDKNIREDMEKFSHLKDKVRYAKRSGDLRRFIENREQIIVTTQQKFHYILKKLSRDKNLHKLRVAFLIDEAHRSQEGRMARERSQPFRSEPVFQASESLAMVAQTPTVYRVGEEEEDEA